MQQSLQFKRSGIIHLQQPYLQYYMNEKFIIVKGIYDIYILNPISKKIIRKIKPKVNHYEADQYYIVFSENYEYLLYKENIPSSQTVIGCINLKTGQLLIDNIVNIVIKYLQFDSQEKNIITIQFNKETMIASLCITAFDDLLKLNIDKSYSINLQNKFQIALHQKGYYSYQYKTIKYCPLKGIKLPFKSNISLLDYHEPFMMCNRLWLLYLDQFIKRYIIFRNGVTNKIIRKLFLYNILYQNQFKDIYKVYLLYLSNDNQYLTIVLKNNSLYSKKLIIILNLQNFQIISETLTNIFSIKGFNSKFYDTYNQQNLQNRQNKKFGRIVKRFKRFDQELELYEIYLSS